MTEKFGIPRRATASRLAPKPIYKPRRGPNDISVLSKSCYGRSLSGDKAVIWRMSVQCDPWQARHVLIRAPPRRSTASSPRPRNSGNGWAFPIAQDL